MLPRARLPQTLLLAVSPSRQSLLHSSGQLEAPLPPAKLLWLRARMRLLQKQARTGGSGAEALASVLRQAAGQRP